MPTGTPHYGHIPPYDTVRVDAFSTPHNSSEYQPARLFLLTHTHSDHVGGLKSKSFGLPLVCSPDAKQMLLLFEGQRTRIAKDQGLTDIIVRPYSHLCGEIPTSLDASRPSIRRDLLRVIPLNTPTLFELEGGYVVTITAIDANHCPGSVMYLIEGPEGAVLHTGDVRSEASMITSLEQNPFLQSYIVPQVVPPANSQTEFTASVSSSIKTLEAIFLDTACMAIPSVLPSKKEAVEDLLRLLTIYPETTYFFINTWTWGYEDILVGIARAFQTKIHVDRYKHRVYLALSNPIFKEILTTDPTASRFHACERFNRCDSISRTPEESLPLYDPATGDRIVRTTRRPPTLVYINPIEMSVERWKDTFEQAKHCLLHGDYPLSLVVPLARHSTLPELRNLVGLFKPKRVVPNTVYPNLMGCDWASIPALFGDVMAPGAGERVWKEMQDCGVGSNLDKERWLHSCAKQGKMGKPDQISTSRLSATLDELFEDSGLDLNSQEIAENIVLEFQAYGSIHRQRTQTSPDRATLKHFEASDELLLEGVAIRRDISPLQRHTTPPPRKSSHTTTSMVAPILPSLLSWGARKVLEASEQASESPTRQRRPGDATSSDPDSPPQPPKNDTRASLGLRPTPAVGTAQHQPGQRFHPLPTPQSPIVTVICHLAGTKSSGHIETTESLKQPDVAGMQVCTTSKAKKSHPVLAAGFSPSSPLNTLLGSNGAILGSDMHKPALDSPPKAIVWPNPSQYFPLDPNEVAVLPSILTPPLSDISSENRKPSPQPCFQGLTQPQATISDIRKRRAERDLGKSNAKRRRLPWQTSCPTIPDSQERQQLETSLSRAASRSSSVDLTKLAPPNPLTSRPLHSTRSSEWIPLPEPVLEAHRTSIRQQTLELTQKFQNSSNPNLVASSSQLQLHEQAKAKELAKKRKKRKDALIALKLNELVVNEEVKTLKRRASEVPPLAMDASLPQEDDKSPRRMKGETSKYSELRRRMSNGEIPPIDIECLGTIWDLFEST